MSDSNPKDETFDGDTVTPGTQARVDESRLETTHSSGERPAVASSQRSLEKGQPVDRYVVLDRLGTGGMGEVYSAWDPVLDRKVALKLLKAEHHDAGKLGDELRLRLMREAQALARVTHPNVVTVHDVGIVDGQIYLAIEFVEGQTLTQWLAEKPRDWRVVLDLFLDAGEGLVAAHEAGVTHRDFKPDNVIVSRQGRARVMDFGLAHAHDAASKEPTAAAVEGSIQRKITSPGVMLGTPAYMSLEALYGRPTDPRSDEFSFAVALYEALYGHRPFAGTTAYAVAAEIEQNRVRPPAKGTQVPRRVHQLLLKAMRADANERFQTVRALLIQLGRRKSSRRRQVLTGIVAGVAVIALVSVVGLWRRETQRCAGLSNRFAGIWDERGRNEARAAFERVGQPWALPAWAETQRLMDAWSSQWVAARTAACRTSAGQADEQLGQTIVCLSRRLADFEATAQLLRHADADVVERSTALVSSLPSIAICDAATATVDRDADNLSAQLAEVRALIDAGKLADAKQRLAGLLEMSNEARAGRALAEATWLSARLAGAELDFPRADALAEDAILLAQQHQADEIGARAWVDRVGFAGAGGSTEHAERWARFAHVAVERFGAPRDLLASLSNNEAVVASRQGHHEDALVLHRKALVLREAVFGPRSALAARSRSNVGSTLRALSKPDEAAEEFRRALTIEEHVLAPEHPAVADTLNNLANALHDLSRDDEALAALQRSLEIREKAFGPSSLKVAQSLSNVGAVLLDVDRPAQALPLLERALAIRETTPGVTVSSVAATLTNLATAQRRTGAYDKAVATDTKALELRTKSSGPKSADLTRNLTGLAASKLLQGDIAAALPFLERALSLAPSGSVERGDALFLMAKALPRADARPVRYLEEALSVWPARYHTRAEAEQLLAR